MGDPFVAYSATGQASTQTVQHVWLNHDDDLIDLTLRTDSSDGPLGTEASDKQQEAELAAHGTRAPPTTATTASQPQRGADAAAPEAETIHTTAKHLWLTADRGWVAAGDLHAGEQVVRLDGSTATVAAVRVMPGSAMRYDLTVSQVHTFVVGDGHYVVHNCGGGAVRYGSTKLSRAVQAARQLALDRKGNYAAAELDDGSIITAHSVVQRTAGKKITIHAEQTLLAQAKRDGR